MSTDQRKEDRGREARGGTGVLSWVWALATSRQFWIAVLFFAALLVSNHAYRVDNTGFEYHQALRQWQGETAQARQTVQNGRSSCYRGVTDRSDDLATNRALQVADEFHSARDLSLPASERRSRYQEGKHFGEIAADRDRRIDPAYASKLPPFQRPDAQDLALERRYGFSCKVAFPWPAPLPRPREQSVSWFSL